MEATEDEKNLRRGEKNIFYLFIRNYGRRKELFLRTS